MEKIFALYDSDVFYATRFMEYFKRKKESDFTISVFTRKDSLEEYLQAHSIEILLLGEGVSTEELNGQNIKYSYRLTDSPYKEVDHNHPTVCKYQPAGTVITEILNDYTEKENATQTKSNSNQANIISVFSPVPGIEKTIFAGAISTLMSEQSKVLYIPLELLPIQITTSINKASQSLTDFIYFLKEKSSIAGKIKILSQHNGNLSTLSGIIHGADLLSLNKEDIQTWVEELRDHTDYNTVVFYIGCYTEAMIELIKLSDAVLIATLKSSYEAMVFKEWERQMGQLGINTNQNKFQYIELQREEEPIPIPAVTSDLSNCSSWDIARQYLNC